MEQSALILANALEAALKQLRTGQKTIGTPTENIPYGPTGFFGLCGTDPLVNSGHLTPLGIDRVLPGPFPTVYVNPLFASLTGFEEDADAEPSTGCANCVSGVMEGCYLTATMGRICREGQTIEIDKVLRRENRGQFTDLVMLGRPLGDGAWQAVPNSMDFLQSVARGQAVTIGVLLQRKLSTMTWQGNPANNVGTGYMEFPGLDLLVNTGKVDAATGTTCPSLDSYVRNFGYKDVCSVTQPDIVNELSMMDFYLRHIAKRSSMSPVSWILAMREELFFELTKCWPCRYLTDGCSNAAGVNVGIINDDANVRLRDEMRNGSFLMLNGRRMPVVTDDGIFEHNSINDGNLVPGQFASDIYQLPLSITGGRPVLYYEYMDYRSARLEAAELQGRQDWWASDDGKFMWALEQSGYCWIQRAKVEPRIILRTPQLAGRLTNVRYSPLVHLRSPFDDDPYFVKGGVEYRSATSWYSEWDGQQR